MRSLCAWFANLRVLGVALVWIHTVTSLTAQPADHRLPDELAELLGSPLAPADGFRSASLSVDPIVIDSRDAAPRVLAAFETPVEVSEVAVLHTLIPGAAIEDWRVAVGLAHRTLAAAPEWPEVLRYELEYADDVRIEVPVRYGESIESWRRIQTVGPMLWARRHHAITMKGSDDVRAVAYEMRFPNPRPDSSIRALRAIPPRFRHADLGRVAIAGVSIRSGSSTGRIFIVDRKPMGDDLQDGSWQQPFGSLARAVLAARPGDVVLVRGGLYSIDAPVVLEMAGDASRRLVLSAFPGESPVLDAHGLHYDHRVPPYGKSGRSRLGRQQHDTGVIHAMGDPSGLTIQGFTIRHSRRAGISVYGQPEDEANSGKSWARTRSVEILFNATERTFSMGIIAHVIDDLAIVGNRVMRPHSGMMVSDPFTGDPAAHDHLPQEAIDVSRVRRFEIAFNSVGGGGKEAIDCISVEEGRIHHNYVHDSLNGIYIDSWSVPIRRLEIHHNFIHNAYSGIPLATEGGGDLIDVHVHHNIVVDSKADGLNVTEATYKAQPARVQGQRLSQNTVVGSGAHASAIGWQGAGINVAGFRDNPEFRDVLVSGNIVVGTTGRPLRNVYHADAVQRGIVFSHNLVHPAGDSTPEWIRSAARGGWDSAENVLGLHAVVADPMFRDPARGDFRLLPGSPAAGAGPGGSDLGALAADAVWEPGTDWAGRPTAFYVGAVRWEPLWIAPDKFTLHRNSLQRPSWFQRNRYGVDFQQLPYGDQAFAGIVFHVPDETRRSGPSVLALRGHSADVVADRIDLAVERATDRIAFLHNYHLADARGIERGFELFRYRVLYADGTEVDVPVRLGQEVDDWLGAADAVNDLPGARLAWTLPVFKRRGAQALRLYAFVWHNPRPTEPVRLVSLLNSRPAATGAPAVFAISLGHEVRP